MTREQRILLRHLIDQAKRQQLAAQKQPRDAYYQTYYSDNSARIRAGTAGALLAEPRQDFGATS